MKKSILKNACFPGKGRQSLHIPVILNVMRFSKLPISYVKLDHNIMLYSINYSAKYSLVNQARYFFTQWMTYEDLH